MENTGEISEGQLTEMTTRVDQEMKEYQIKYGDDWSSRYFNNFHEHMPDVIEPQREYYRNQSKSLGYWDRKDSELVIHQKEMARFPDNVSKLRFNQTAREFYEVIDKMIEAAGLSREEVSRAVNKAHHATKESDYVQFHKLILPVWIRLRALGYTIHELAG